MKTKQSNRNKLAMTLFIVLCSLFISFIACDEGNNNPAEQPKNQSQTITFGADLSTTVTGNMTDTQWNAVIGKLTTALNAAANGGGNIGYYCAAFFEAGFNIDLVKTQEYNYYKVDAALLKFFLNADYVIGATETDLSTKVTTMINSAFDPSVPMQE